MRESPCYDQKDDVAGVALEEIERAYHVTHALADFAGKANAAQDRTALALNLALPDRQARIGRETSHPAGTSIRHSHICALA
jgi:hypothetical protein